MKSVLIVSNTSSTMEIISGLLVSQVFSRIVTARSGVEARRFLLESEFDLVIIDAPLPDEMGDDFALHAAECSSCGVILIVESDGVAEISASVEDYGVFTVPKSVSPDVFFNVVTLMNATRMRVKKLEDENRRLLNKIEELKFVDRAKCTLIQVLKMTEQQAHRYIEKQSMDLRQPRIVVAENILKTYER